jgi:hypothetical protein
MSLIRGRTAALLKIAGEKYRKLMNIREKVPPFIPSGWSFNRKQSVEDSKSISFSYEIHLCISPVPDNFLIEITSTLVGLNLLYFIFAKFGSNWGGFKHPPEHVLLWRSYDDVTQIVDFVLFYMFEWRGKFLAFQWGIGIGIRVLNKGMAVFNFNKTERKGDTHVLVRSTTLRLFRPIEFYWVLIKLFGAE